MADSITPNPKDALVNLWHSVKIPLIAFGAGFIACLIWQAKKGKKPDVTV